MLKQPIAAMKCARYRDIMPAAIEDRPKKTHQNFKPPTENKPPCLLGRLPMRRIEIIPNQYAANSKHEPPTRVTYFKPALEANKKKSSMNMIDIKVVMKPTITSRKRPEDC